MEITYSTSQNGLHAATLRQGTIADNLANLVTPGFKTRLVDQSTLVGPGTAIDASRQDFTQGAPEDTGIDTDLFINGEGFFQVETDNEPAYTRVGNFRIDENGDLVTPSGNRVEPSINIPEDTVAIQVRADGIMFAIDGNGEALDIGQLELVKFINPSGLVAIGDNLYVEGANSGDPQIGAPGDPGFGTVVQRALEQSNVDPADQITDQIVTQRYYQLNLRVFQTADQLVGRALDLFS